MLTIYDWFGYEIPIKDRYRLIKEAGFDGVLMWWSDLLNRGDYRSGPALAREAGLFVENIHTPFQVQDDLWSNNLAGEASVNCYLQCVGDCAEFEIATMVVHLPHEEYSHNNLGMDRIKQITEKAERLGVNVALENLRNFSNLSYVLEQINSPRIGFCYDTSQHYRKNPEIDFLSMYGSRLIALHLHDCTENAIHRLPFDGILNWPLIMQNIAKTGYSGATAIEAMNWEYQDITAQEFLRQAFERAKKCKMLRM